MEIVRSVCMSVTKTKVVKGWNVEAVTVVGGKTENAMMFMNIPFPVMAWTKCV